MVCLVKFLMDPPNYEWFYDLKHDAIMAMTTITTRIYVYLGCFHDTSFSSALSVLTASPAALPAPSADPVQPQTPPVPPEFKPVSLGLPSLEPMPPEVPMIELSSTSTPA